ncbi:MAG: type II secretion system protein [Pelomonas sp.]|nr:type II secretion system protein [Roseateles sp.]
MMKRVRGVGLLEAIVALVILATSGLALFSWIGQSIADVRRTEDAQARAALQLTALAVLTSVNPQAEPQGERRVGRVVVRWTSQLLEPLRYSLPYAGSQGPRWEVGLYRLTVVASDEPAGIRVDFSMDQTGLRQLDTGGPRPGMDPP